jgi:sporulation protein YlmC with PRC-barrel domain
MQNTQQANTTSALIESNHVEGTEVFDPTGKHVGVIKRLVIDKRSGRVVYTVASFGGFLGMGTDQFTIPWNALAYDTTLNGYVTNITPDRLREAPDFARNDGNDFWTDRASEQTLYNYYGTSTYWTE